MIQSTQLHRLLAQLTLLICVAGCGSEASDAVPVAVADEAGEESEEGSAASVLFPDLAESMPASGSLGASPAAPGGRPESFSAAEVGGFRLGAALGGGAPETAVVPAEGRADGCGSVLTGLLRDVRESHPDFGGEVTNLQRGLVQSELGADGKPVLSRNFERGFIESAASFRQWYETVPGVNLPYALELYLEPSDGKYSFESHDFFPLDGEGFGNEGQNHNFSFTLELHTRFRYSGGEVFEFSGDDDLWVFVNGVLAIDLGGVHAASSQELDLDDAADRLGIVPGNEYSLDFFQAERHATESNFQIDTTLEFTNCGAVLR